jgi:O-antigen ligase
MTESNAMRSTARAAEIFAVALTFLLPLKFGALTGVAEVASFYPDSVFAWIIVTWPPALFTLSAGVLLALTTLIPGPGLASGLRASPAVPLLWTGLALAGLAGYIRAVPPDYAAQYITHLTGLAAFAWAVCALIGRRPELLRTLLITAAAATLIAALDGVYQFFTGFEETRDFAYQQELNSGVSFVDGNFKTRLYESRVFSTFSLCNSFAAHLLLTIPLCVWAVLRFAGRVEPPKVSRAVFGGAAAALLFAMLFLTESRASWVSFVAAAALSAMLVRFPLKIKAGIVTAGILAAAALFIFFMLSHRGLASLGVRFDYWTASVKIFLSHPLEGAGWGGFFHDYMLIKTWPSDEAPHSPHNFILTFASQTGAAGLVFSCAALFWPLWRGARRLWGRPFREMIKSLDFALFLGLLAWVFHSLADLNFEVGGSAATAILISAALCRRDSDGPAPGPGLAAAVRVFMLFLTASAVWMSMTMIRRDLALAELQSLCDFRFKTREEFAAVTPEMVLRQLRLCSGINPDSPFPWASAADFMMTRGRVQAAKDMYTEAARRSPARPAFYYRLYLINKALGNGAEAIKNLETAQKLFPKNEKYRVGR